MKNTEKIAPVFVLVGRPQTALWMPLVAVGICVFLGVFAICHTPEGLRRPMLYPPELQAHLVHNTAFTTPLDTAGLKSCTGFCTVGSPRISLNCGGRGYTVAYLKLRANGIWHILYTDHTGRECSKTTKTRNKKTALRRLLLWEKRLAEEEFEGGPGRDPKVMAFRNAYDAWGRRHLTRMTLNTQLNRWDLFVAQSGVARLGDISPAVVREFVAHLHREGKAANTINNYLRDLQALLNHAKNDLGIWTGKENPVAGVRRMTVESVYPRALELDQVQALLAAAEAHSESMHAWCLLGLYAGLRYAEIVRCQWEHFDWARRELTVPTAAGASTKSHASRVVPIARELLERLQPMDKRPGYVVYPDAEQGRHHYRVDPKKAFKTVAAKAGLPKEVSTHWLRHTFATQHARAGKSIYLIAEWLGQSSVTVTKRYAHVRGFNPAIDGYGDV